MINPLRIAFLPLALCAAVQTASAQKLVFHQIAWDTPAESVRARVDSLGFTFDREADGGDHLFRREDGAWLRAYLRNGRVMGFLLIDPARGEQVPDRFRVLADSLQAALGAPDEMDEEQDGRSRQNRLWEAGLASVSVGVFRVRSVDQVEVMWRAPGWYDEMARRADEPPPPAGFTTVSVTPFLQMAVDTTVRGPRGGGALRGRFRIKYHQPVTPQLNGVAQAALDAVVYEMDFDCAARRTRLIARTTYLEGREQGSHRPTSQAWAVPQPDGHYDKGLDVVCRAARRG
jgi:hypothetical protein